MDRIDRITRRDLADMRITRSSALDCHRGRGGRGRGGGGDGLEREDFFESIEIDL